jgi:hypothetical protein
VPFVAASVDQLRVGDEVEANAEDGSLERGVIRRIEPCFNGRDMMIHFGGSQYLDSLGWYFDPHPHFGFTRTWTVLNRDLEPEVVTPRPGDRIALVRRREGVVREVGDDPPAGKAATGERHEFVGDGALCALVVAETSSHGRLRCNRPADAAVHQTTTEDNK